jgi:hypothetical protein
LRLPPSLDAQGIDPARGGKQRWFTSQVGDGGPQGQLTGRCGVLHAALGMRDGNQSQTDNRR